MRIEPARRLAGKLSVPGDKSISHRAAIIAALAGRGRSRLSNFSDSADCASTLRCLRQLGVGIRREGNDVIVDNDGAGSTTAKRRQTPRLLRAAVAPLDCGNSGSTMRMLAGVLAGQPFSSVLTGDESLRSRPMRRIVEPLELMGARIRAEDGRAPLRVEGRAPLDAIRYEMKVASAQVKSAILLAGLSAAGRTEVIERDAATRDHTERMLRWFGVEVETKTEDRSGAEGRGVEAEAGTRRGDVDADAETSVTVSLKGGTSFEGRDFDVPGDISSGAFLVAAAALLPGSSLVVEGVGLNPTRAQILRTLRALGADVGTENVREHCNEKVGDIRVGGADVLRPPADRETQANVISGSAIAGLIDELPVLAVVGTQVEGGLEIRGASELRVKESDRIATTVENLRAMGAEVEEFADGLAVAGAQRLRGARLHSHGDHRIAMAFAVAALVAEGASELEGAECVGVSFPEFFRLLESLTER